MTAIMKQHTYSLRMKKTKQQQLEVARITYYTHFIYISYKWHIKVPCRSRIKYSDYPAFVMLGYRKNYNNNSKNESKYLF